MVLVDVGNTSVHLGLARKGRLDKVYNFKTARFNKTFIRAFLSRYPEDELFICSVVPKITAVFRKLKQEVYVVGQDVSVGIKCLYNRETVGMDRLVGAYAAKELFPKARLIIDFGTAITFDFLSKNKQYLGGLILPGVGSTLRVFSECALLPQKVKFTKVKGTIPKDTQASIVKGVQDGFSAMVNTLAAKYKKKLKLGTGGVPIVTGGDARLIIPNLNFPLIYEPLLVLKGLLILSERIP